MKKKRKEANESYIKSVEAEREEIQIFEDEEDEVNLEEALASIRERKAAIEWRIDVENRALSSKLKSPKRKIDAQEKILELRDSYKKVIEDEKIIKEKIDDTFSKLKKDREELERKNKEDMNIINDENASSYEKTAAEVRVEMRNEEIKQLTTRIEGMERERPLREKVKDIFKKYGVTVAAIVVAAGVTIGAVVGAITNALKSMGKGIANGLKAIGKKTASLLPGTARIDRFFPLQNSSSGCRFSGRAHLAIDSGRCGLSGRKLHKKAALT